MYPMWVQLISFALISNVALYHSQHATLLLNLIQNLKCACALSHPPHKKDEEVNGVLHS